MKFVKFTPKQESASHKRTSHAARSRRREAQKTAPLNFVCVDGEGQTFEDGTHRYVLLGVGQEQIENPDGLSWEEILSFLYSQFQPGGTAFTGFFLGYDFVQWLRKLPEERARMLLTAQGKAKRQRTSVRPDPFPVEYHDWEFDILGNKRFKLRPSGESRWMYICDTGPFFQKSFLRVIDPGEWPGLVTPEEYADIERGKNSRAAATLGPEMRRYNKLENELLARVLHELDKGFRELDIHLSPKQWFGPGQAAQQWLEGRAPESGEVQDLVPDAFLSAARDSYYGGWFEIMAHGLVPGSTYEYDINSAYPHVISSLPCLRHGLFESGDGPPPMPGKPGELSLVYVTAWQSKYQEVSTHYPTYMGPLPWRDVDGTVARPQITEGWYWNDELEAAIRGKLLRRSNIQYHRWQRYSPCECPPPFAEVGDIYTLRQRVGKKTPLGIACKLVPNSLYGKFAQSIGNPKFGNPIYASRITSECRRIILDAIATHPQGKKAVVMVATDGVYFREPHPTLRVSGVLGEWDTSTKHNLVLFKPGVYWDDTARQRIRDGQAAEFKARGVNAKDFSTAIQELDTWFSIMAENHTIPDPEKNQVWPYATFPLSFTMVSAAQALHRNAWNTAGTVSTSDTITQSSSPYSKRMAPYWDGDIIRSHPRYVENPISTPYSKKFGMDDPFSDLSLEQFGVTPDGLPGQLIRGMMIP